MCFLHSFLRCTQEKKQEGEQTGTTQEMSTSSSDPQKRPPFMASGSPTVNNPREESRNG